MDDPGTHYFRVVLSVDGFREKLGDEDPLRLVMPVWAPGSYMVREFARNVLDVSVRDSNGRTLETQKESKNSWTVRLDGASDVTVSYSVYAFAHTSQQSYLDSDHAVINGASVFLFVCGLEGEGLTLEVVPHPSWGVVSTGLSPLPGGAAHEFHAANYDALARFAHRGREPACGVVRGEGRHPRGLDLLAGGHRQGQGRTHWSQTSGG